MKTIIVTLVKKTLAIHREDQVTNQEIVFTLLGLGLIVTFTFVLGRSIFILVNL